MLSWTFPYAILMLGCLSLPDRLAGAELLGRFDKERDLLLAQFDSKTDVDDIHSIAAVATVLADTRCDGIAFHAVAGAYGTQGGLYVPSDDLFDMAFGQHWSDAHADRDQALKEVAQVASETLREGGKIWIAEAGQSYFSAALVRALQAEMPEVDFKSRFCIVQHANWNEEVTTPADLEYVRAGVTYKKIPDGNGKGNGTPGLRDDRVIDWRSHITDERLVVIWEKAITIADAYNGKEGRYLNESILRGGLDFSDTVETLWIFGIEGIVDAEGFFREFASTGQEAN